MIYSKRKVGRDILKYRGIYAITKSEAEAKKSLFKKKYPLVKVRYIPTIAKFGKYKGKKVYLQYANL